MTRLLFGHNAGVGETPQTKSGPQLRLGKIFRFWLPLASTWLMMSAEGPLLAALIARLAEPKANLAAYGVAFSFALLIEAPIIMIMSASTALVRGRTSFDRLKRFTYGLNFAVTALMVAILAPPVFDFLVLGLIGLPEDIGRLTHLSLVILLPWPGVIGYRRFYQGILIRRNLTRRVAYGTVIRLAAMTATAFGFYFFTDVAGALVGAAALSTGVTLEALASRAMAAASVRKLRLDADQDPEQAVSYGYIARFYYPLAMTSILSLGVHPMITFFVGQSRMAIESLAVLPVVNSLVFIFRSCGLAYQEVAIALIGDDFEGYEPLRNFAGILMAGAALGLAAIAFTPLQLIWFRDVSGLSAELSRLAGTTAGILAAMPALAVLLSFQRAMVVNLRITRFVTWATAIEVLGIGIVLYLTIRRLDWVGATAAAAAMMAGRTAANLYLAAPLKAALNQRLPARRAKSAPSLPIKSSKQAP